MAKDKKAVIIYADWISIFDKLTNEEAGILIKHFFAYVNDKNPDAPDRLTDIVFEPIKQQLKRDLKKYEAMCLRNKNNGSKGGRPKQNPDEPKKPTGLNGNPNNPNEPDTDTDTDTEKDTDNKENNIPFEIFWDLYDKKIDRIKCESKWNKLTDKERQECIYYLPAYIEATPDIQFRRHPATYLNNKSWQNEIINYGTHKQGNGATQSELRALYAKRFGLGVEK